MRYDYLLFRPRLGHALSRKHHRAMVRDGRLTMWATFPDVRPVRQYHKADDWPNAKRKEER